MAVEPMGIQIDQMPIAFPLFSGANRKAMISGAVTAIRLRPAPSMRRLSSRVVMPPLKAPAAAPAATQKRAITPVVLYPSL